MNLINMIYRLFLLISLSYSNAFQSNTIKNNRILTDIHKQTLSKLNKIDSLDNNLENIGEFLKKRQKKDIYIISKISDYINYIFKKDKLLSTIKSFSVITRIKSAHSINNKLLMKGLTNINSIRDIIGLRIIINEDNYDEEHLISLCYHLLRCISMSSYVNDITNLKDYIRAPKKNGYKSLHATIIPSISHLSSFEIQIRTKKMDDDALFGKSSHYMYKQCTNY